MEVPPSPTPKRLSPGADNGEISNQQPPAKDVEIGAGDSSAVSSVKSLTAASTQQRSDEWVEINDDVYNMFFLSRFGGQAFWYAAYIFVLKMTLYVFLAMDAFDVEQPTDVSVEVLVTQFFMLPVAVAMQDDLIATYYLVANIKYSPLVKMQCPDATKWKFHAANLFRGIDGMFSLLVNFVILLKATEVLSLFLNFAALQFLQTIDNIALRLCAEGYLSDRLELVANQVTSVKLPNKNNQLYRSMDSILFLSTFAALLIGWAMISFG
uniref:Uncharacterized protein n=1 Tax=Entomoneis paludosa TaxID=265537 RepID=A0A7S2VCQ9_9STRA|mmetsp:Transcript_14630/g.30210  ORF Transcript_14630/g.30210 Transcript_14630/m.30210 type:complete len:267 (+) Transcript_14630:165-965(+)|eukprot:CAMPEP_0172470366 /NCGR_PEP_ID=MMETSP1065-20121228/66116_1 /TAXON_ID=265537 /ORGANISM="Amphiprora paludosa, Strain CCMP125" /LENGTH=266 /DNA_ID=CAMNT_0013228271 /DNA_START=87 /DNA_END=887 /DNA_ORIENTATION=-